MNGRRRLPSVGRHTGAVGSTGVPSEAKAHPLLVMNLVSIIMIISSLGVLLLGDQFN